MNVSTGSRIGPEDESPDMNCDFIAPWYEPVEHLCFGQALQRRRTAYLEKLGDSRRAISFGEGDGRFTAALLRSNPHLEVIAVDASRRMQQIAARRVAMMGESFRERAEFHCAEIDTFDPGSAKYDLIATHFFFDCFSTDATREVIQRIAGWAAPRAQWVVSEFHQPPGRLGRFWTGAIIRGLYAAFRVTTGLRVVRLPNYHAALVSAGFKLRRQEFACGGLLISELWERG